MSRVVILMSTWNGMKYLPEQIHSLFQQDLSSDLFLLVRDDGSTDSTVDYLRSLKDPRVLVVPGENVGPKGSFFQLLKLAQSEDADYFALCDQDDFWHPHKISHAIAALGVDRPAIYASSLNLVDENLYQIGKYLHPGNHSFVSTLVCNYITGCTCVFNRGFLDQLAFPERPDFTIMHDWWIASIASIDSHIVYDCCSSIDYRQHGSNHVGIQTGWRALWLKLRKAVVANPEVSRFRHAEQLLAATEDRLTSEQRADLIEFIASEHSRLRRLSFVTTHHADLNFLSAFRYVVFG